MKKSRLVRAGRTNTGLFAKQLWAVALLLTFCPPTEAQSWRDIPSSMTGPGWKNGRPYTPQLPWNDPGRKTRPMTEQEKRDFDKRIKEREKEREAEERQKAYEQGVESRYAKEEREKREQARKDAQKQQRESYESKMSADKERYEEERQASMAARQAATLAARQQQLAAYKYEQARLAEVMQIKKSGQVAEAVTMLGNLAAQGCPNAPFVLGTMYLKGDGVKPDKKKAISLFYAAAKAGSANGSYALGQVYLEGNGVTRNDQEALMWLDMSTTPAAQYLLGSMYLEGVGTEKNYEKAWKALKNAANQNDVRAMASLGEICYFGLGMPKSTVQAQRWFDLAARKENPKALYYMYKIYATGDGVEQNDALAADFMSRYNTAKAKLAKATSREQQLCLKDLSNLESRIGRFSSEGKPAAPPTSLQPTGSSTASTTVAQQQSAQTTAVAPPTK